MVHTLPDYTSKWRSDTPTFNLSTGEIARRINPLSSLDNRGRMIWFDDAQGELTRWNEGVFVGSSASKTTNRPYFGDEVYRLETTAAAGSKIYFSGEVDPGIISRYGFEVLFAEMGNSQYLELVFSYMDQTDYLVSEFRLDLLNDRIYIDPNNDGTWHLISNHLFDGNNRTYHHIKLVGDAVTQRWVRMILNGVETDLSAYAWNRSAAGICARMGMSINLVNTAATAAKMNIGGIMVTDQEP